MADTVTVGCLLPNGIEVEINGQPILLKGANTSVIAGIPGTYGLTEGVDKDGFEKFMKDYASLPFIKNGAIFAQSTPAKADAAAQEKVGEVKTGLEGLNQDAIKASGVVKDDGK